MTDQDIIDNAKGLLQGVAGAMNPPYRVLVPHDCVLSSHEAGENVTLEQRIKDLSPDIKEVKNQKGRGVSIESVGDEECAKKKAGY